MTPQEEALQQQVSNLPVFKEVINDLEGLRKGQEALGVYVAEGFTKGKDRMDGLEEMFKDHINTTKDNHKETMGAYTDLKLEIRDNKFKDLKEENAALQKKAADKEKRKWDLIKGLLLIVAASLVSGISVKFFG